MKALLRHLILVIAVTAISVVFLSDFNRTDGAEDTPSLADIRLGMSKIEVRDILGSPPFTQEVNDVLSHWYYDFRTQKIKTQRQEKFATLSITFEPNVTRVSAAAAYKLGDEPQPGVLSAFRPLRLKSDPMPPLSIGEPLGLFEDRLANVTRLEKDEGPFFPPAIGPKLLFSTRGGKVAIATAQNRVTGLCIAESFGEFWPPKTSKPVLSLSTWKDPSFCGECFVKMDHGRNDVRSTHPCPFGCQECIHNRGGTYPKSHGLYGE